jgi:hypothetical protein
MTMSRILVVALLAVGSSGCADLLPPAIDRVELRDASGKEIDGVDVAFKDEANIDDPLPVDGAIAVVFSKGVDRSSAQRHITVEMGGIPVAVQFEKEDDTILIRGMDGMFEPDAALTLFVEKGIEDDDEQESDDEVEVEIDTEPAG